MLYLNSGFSWLYGCGRCAVDCPLCAVKCCLIEQMLGLLTNVFGKLQKRVMGLIVLLSIIKG